MPRLRTIVLAFGALLVLLLAATFVVLPPVVRSVAVDRIARLTGRATALEKVEINVLTGRVALRGFRLAQRGSGDPALEVEALEVRLSLASLVTRHIRVASLTVTSPSVHVARLSATEFDFSDLLALVPPPDPGKPSTYVTLERPVARLPRGLPNRSRHPVSSVFAARGWVPRSGRVACGHWSLCSMVPAGCRTGLCSRSPNCAPQPRWMRW